MPAPKKAVTAPAGKSIEDKLMDLEAEVATLKVQNRDLETELIAAHANEENLLGKLDQCRDQLARARKDRR
jgi:predicted RNase H-like nuclease (RuvC/YqgF family)